MDYTALKNRITGIIDRNSTKTISFSRVDTTGYTKQYDPATDADVWYKNGVAVTAPSETTHTGTCIEININDYFIDDEVQLGVLFDPVNATDKTVTWSTSNTDVATVTQTGLVTFLNNLASADKNTDDVSS